MSYTAAARPATTSRATTSAPTQPGSATIANHLTGIDLNTGAANNTIGGTATGAGNVVSGNQGHGIELDSGVTGTLIAGNLVGLDATGTFAVGNQFAAVVVLGASHTTIGGTTAAARNVISGNQNNGIALDGAGTNDTLIEGNYIGTNANGTAAVANVAPGIAVLDQVTNTTIGGTTAGAGNLVSGNDGAGIVVDNYFGTGAPSGVVIEGNQIGTNAAGTAAIANLVGVQFNGSGIEIISAPGATIGGTAVGAGNLISGNDSYGVYITGAASTGVSVVGNYIGTNAAGTSALGNSGDGVSVQSNNNTIGGSASGAANVISGNGYASGSPLPTGITSWYQANGNANDSVSGINGSAVGSVSYVAGVSGSDQAFSFNGTDYVQIPYSAALQPSAPISSAAQITLDGWIEPAFSGRPAGSTLDTILSSLPSGSGAGYLLGVLMNSTAGAWTGYGTANSVPSVVPLGTPAVWFDLGGQYYLVVGNTTVPNDGHYHNVAATYDGSTIRLFLDGVQVGSLAASGDLAYSGSAGETIGQDADLGIDSTANISDVGLYARALSLAEIQSIYNANGANTLATSTANGVEIDASATGNVVLGNLIGTNAAGTGPLGNSNNGVLINGGANNTIGGTTAAARNIISGNTDDGVLFYGPSATGNVVEGDYIGTDVTGAFAVANFNGVGSFVDGGGETIGGPTATPGTGAGNVISGNSNGGIILGNGDLVEGNLIGTNAAGTAALGNESYDEDGYGGIFIIGAGNSSNDTIGGTASDDRNVISGNVGPGINLTDVNGNLIEGNYIGLDITGMTAIPNLAAGIEVGGSSDNTIGGTGSGAGNVISGYQYYGEVVITYENAPTTGNVVEGNFIGTNAAGNGIPSVVNFNGGGAGVVIGDGADSNTIGGTTASARNIISGNSDGIDIGGNNGDGGANGNVVEGNYIGTNAAGTAALGNSGTGILIGGDAAGNIIGGTTPGAGNLISGNNNDGISITGSGATGSVVEGNYIGTNAAGNATALGNSGNGVYLTSGTANNIIGGTTTAARNIISGNGSNGILLSGSSSGGNLVEGNYLGTDTSGTVALGNAIAVVRGG